ncbi:MAG: flagellar export chaperone FliS [Lachnospiraceae bacterium]|nr:flagellar export chaperone FliS [Lachnospiraceae bacterium]
MTKNPYQQYKNNAIATATPAELTLMLYEGAIKFGNIAIKAIEEGDIQKAHINIVKVQRIITEFRNTLDFKYPVAKDFDRVYEYLERRLVEANVSKDKEIMEEMVMHIRSMRDNWKEVMKRAKQPQSAAENNE